MFFVIGSDAGRTTGGRFDFDYIGAGVVGEHFPAEHAASFS